ncbi:MAG: hypothetical protein P8P74_07950 [Crocinitomicaceae bacterium]|nr:hypothetical protein [Crocinitomicaceae bacterium]
MNISNKMSWTNLSKTLIQNGRLSVLSTALMLFIGLSAHGQKLEDFTECAAKPTIANMPYTRIRREALALESKKKDAFKAVSGYGFDRLKDEKDAILKKIETQVDKIEDAKEEIKDDEKRSPGITSPGVKKKEDAEDEIKDLKDDIKDVNAKIDKAIDKFKALQEARKKVREIFEDVNDELDNSLNRPHVHIGPKPSSSDREAMDKYNDKLKELKRCVYKIGGEFDKKAKTHKDEEDGAETTWEALEKLKEKEEI